MKSPEVLAVIPSYNSSDLAMAIGQSLLESSFSHVIIIDDASRADEVAKLEKTENITGLEVIRGGENYGPGGNRNRILPALKGEELVVFIDADMELAYKGDLAELVRGSFVSDNVGVTGYRILNKDGSPMGWNFGTLMHPIHEARDFTVQKIYEKGAIDKDAFIRFAPELAASCNVVETTQPREVGWVAEGCFAIRADLFKKIHGFAASMRYHETHDLNVRVQKEGYSTVFNPMPVVKHLAYDSRMVRRAEDERKARYYYYKTHWGMKPGTFRKLFPK